MAFLMMVWDFLESSICRSKKRDIGGRAVQNIDKIIKFADHFGKLSCVLALADHLPDGQVWLVVMMRLLMRSAMRFLGKVFHILHDFEDVDVLGLLVILEGRDSV